MSKPDHVDREEVLLLLDAFWTFGKWENHTHTWHDRNDCIDSIRALPSLAPSPLDVAARELAEAAEAVVRRMEKMLEDGDQCAGEYGCECGYAEAVREVARYREIREGNDAR